MAQKAIRMMMGGYGSDDQVILPLMANIENENIYIREEGDESERSPYEYDTIEEAFDELKRKWEGLSWGFEGKVWDMELIDVYTPDDVALIKWRESLEPELPFTDAPKPEREYVIIKDMDDLTKDGEFDDTWGYTELMIDGELYSRPFDKSPDGAMFISYFSLDCMKGAVYSKDFAYFECCECNRTICEQNPSNGWMSQCKWWPVGCDDTSERICNKCFEEEMFANGLDIDEILRCKTIPAAFYNSDELKRNGFQVVGDMDCVLVGMGRSGSQDESVFFRKLTDHLDELKGKVVLFESESMSIGELGGYITVWAKDKAAA